MTFDGDIIGGVVAAIGLLGAVCFFPVRRGLARLDELEKRTNEQGEIISALKAWEKAQNGTIHRVEKKIDDIGAKLDRALERRSE